LLSGGDTRQHKNRTRQVTPEASGLKPGWNKMQIEGSMKNSNLFGWIILVLLCNTLAFGQRIQAKVEVDLQKLPMDNQQKLANLDNELDQYLNQYQWTPDDYNYAVPATINVYFEEAKAVSREDRYSARLIVSNESDVQYSDYRWDFVLDAQPHLQHSMTYDSFTGIIDFYVYLILGFEFDRIEKLGGRDYFQKAQNVVEQAKFNSRFIRGWDRRESILQDILSDSNQTTREMRFYYYTGIYYFNNGAMDDAQKYLVKALSYFEKLPSEAMTRFYSLNYHPMGDALGQLGMKSELELLMRLDPDKEHKAYYQTQWDAVTKKEE
jgi:tetratricopeptide (TPR) repeat protein